ncbi:SPP2 isoform 2 [Pan troglodytes]|uniref:Secreted phosphoprotein 24 n=3 Tax=Pan TaxID=9596 RepID=A0A6D2XAX8_PANTR|nr:secreted phosphoprotein 24 [Pan paniscus]XP_016806254.1 secreted phosphoprotein 24 [Pan troglodytes]PNI70209.1 SPP2 isoform 1 [Pan troglodytes]PNI70210.1 SPP2 isoform 2 [Pan troglodytes]
MISRMEKMTMMMKILIMFALGMNYWSCSGFPVYDYDPSSLRDALSASVAKVNSQSLSPYLFRAFRSSLKRVEVLDENNLVMNLEFSIRETTCRKDSGEDPTTCAFQRDYYVSTAVCRSTVKVSAQQVQGVHARCSWSSSTSESYSSSEEMIFGDMFRSHKWRNNYLFGLISDESISEQFYDRSLGIMRRVLPPGNRRYPNHRHRARINTDFE